MLGGKLAQHSHWMLVWVKSIQNPKHPLSGTHPESKTNIHWVPSGHQPNEKTVGNWRSIGSYTLG